MKEDILNLLETRGDLPPLSDTLLSLESRVNDLNSDIKEISDLIKMEPVLQGRLIKLSNSVLFGGGRDDIQDVKKAVMRLGLKMVLDLAYTLELPKVFKKSKHFDHSQFWKHSLGVAYISKDLAAYSGASKENLEASYLAGLMHDIGILVFDYLIPEEYAGFLKTIGVEGRTLSQLEIKRFGVSHSVLGAEFVEKWWQMSETVVKSIKRHHKPPPTKKIKPAIPRLVNWANQIANNNGMGNGIPGSCPHLDESIFPMLKISQEELEHIIVKTKEGIEEAEKTLKSR